MPVVFGIRAKDGPGGMRLGFRGEG